MSKVTIFISPDPVSNKIHCCEVNCVDQTCEERAFTARIFPGSKDFALWKMV